MKNRYFFIILILLAGISFWIVKTNGQRKSMTSSQDTKNQTVTGTDPAFYAINGNNASTSQKAMSTESTNTSPRAEMIDYVAVSGDTISSIAEKFGISVNTILWANNLSLASIISLNQKLVILPVSGFIYKVKSNDTLIKIASEFNVEADKIVEANKLNTSSLKINQSLIIPGAKKLPATSIAQKPSPISTLTKKAAVSGIKSSGVTWTSSALTELYKVPSFIRLIVRTKINNYAKSHGIKVITKEIYKSIKV